MISSRFTALSTLAKASMLWSKTALPLAAVDLPASPTYMLGYIIATLAAEWLGYGVHVDEVGIEVKNHARLVG